MYNPNIYNTNPYMNYGNYYNQQPQQQAMQQNLYRTPMGLQGKQIDSLDVVKATDIPLDGSVSYFPLANGTAIATKRIKNDGSSEIIIYKPTEAKDIETKYITVDEFENALRELNINELDDIKEDIKEIKKQLKKRGE